MTTLLDLNLATMPLHYFRKDAPGVDGGLADDSMSLLKTKIWGVQMLNAMAETYSTVGKGMKENKQCTNGDY